MGHERDTVFPPVSAIFSGLRYFFTRCGMERLFDGILNARPVCDICDLGLQAVDSADGPPVFVMFIVGLAVFGLALWLEVAVASPYWLHMLIWPPLVVVGSIALLRLFMATQIALQFRNEAGESGLNTFDSRN